MYLVKLWLLLNTIYEENHCNSHRLAQLKRQFPHVKYDVDEVAITTGLWSMYSVSKTTNNMDEALSVKYNTNIADALEEAGKGPVVTHVRYI